MSQHGETSARQPRRRWYQYSLRTLLGLVTVVVGLLVAWRTYIEPYARQRQTMKLIERLGGTYQTAEAPKWLRRLYGDDLQNITVVNLADCEEPDEYIDAIALVPELEVLVVGGEAFTDDYAHRLRRLRSLRALVLDGTSMTEPTLAAWHNECSDLELVASHRKAIQKARQRVRIDTSNDLSREALAERVGWEFLQVPNTATFFKDWLADQAFEDVKKLKGLSTITLEDTPASDDCLQHLADMTNLEGLNLYNTKVTDAGLVHLRGLRNLQFLKLSLTAVGNDGSAYLGELKHLVRLELSYSQIGDDALAHIRGLTELRWLSLGSTRITNAGAVHLAGFSNLKYLDLSHTRVTDAGLAYLSGLTALMELDLDDTRVADAGLSNLSRLNDLTSLSLNGAAVSDEGLPYLRSLTQLRYLGLANTKITPAGARRLLGDLTKCSIHY